MIKRIYVSAFLLVCSIAVFAQSKHSINKDLLCKIWKLEKYQEADGKIYPIPAEMKNDYLTYNCDGTMESIEQEGLVKGKWTYNEDTKTITVTQSTNKNYPAKVEIRIIKLTTEELVVEAKDAGGATLVMYMKPK